MTAPATYCQYLVGTDYLYFTYNGARQRVTTSHLTV